MRITICERWRLVSVTAGLLMGILHWPAVAAAQSLGGVTDTVTDTLTGTTNTLTGTTDTLLGATATLADTGTLSAGTSDALQASELTAGIDSLLSGEVLHATTIGYPDQIDSEASMAALDLNLSGTSIGADFVMSRATAAIDDGSRAASNIDRLTINGVPIDVSGAPNQTIEIPGGVVVLNEQQRLSDGTLIVNALHATVDGVADVVVASAMAGLSGGSAKAVDASY